MFDSNDAGLFGLFNLFSGGSFQNFTIFALSITPYITSSIILQLLTVAIPKLEELSKQGEEGRRKIAALTRYITIALALIQAIGYTFGLFGGVLSDDSILSKIVIVLCLIAGTTFLMWLGERINEKGIGNGISLIIFAGIVSRVPTTITSTFTKLTSGEASIISVILFIIFALLIIVGIIMVEEGVRKIPVQYAKKVVGRKMYGGQSTHIPMKVNQAGVIPVIFSLALLQFPITITYFMRTDNGFSQWVSKWLSPAGSPGVWIYSVFNVLLIGLIPIFPAARQARLAMVAVSVLIVNVLNAFMAPGLTVWHIQSIPGEVRKPFFSLITMTVGAIVALANCSAASNTEVCSTEMASIYPS